MKAMLIYNPQAMKGKIDKKVPYIVKRIMTKYETCDVTKPASGAEAERVAKECADKYDLIIVAGGDGSIHHVANGIAKSGADPKMAVLPFGTVNDIAHNLHIPDKLDGAIDVVLRGCVIPYDLIFDGKNYNVYTLAGGKFVNVSYETKSKGKRIWGKLAYLFAGFCSLFNMRTIPLTIATKDVTMTTRFSLALILNSYFTAGVYINDQSSVNDGLMDVILIRKRGNAVTNYFISMWTMLCMMMFGVKFIKKFKNVTFLRTDCIKIENHSNAIFTADGERAEFLNVELHIGDKSRQINMLHGIQL